MISSIDLNMLNQAFSELSDQVCEVWEGSDEPSPMLVRKAMVQLFDILNRSEAGNYKDPPESLKGEEINELGEYGMTLLQEMVNFADDLGLDETAKGLEDLSFPFAVWLARQDCEIKTIAPLVNAIASKANEISEPHLLKQLYAYLNEVLDAVSPSVSQDLDKSDDMRPWRRLLINRAIIATRTLDTDIMKMAFDNLLEWLPEEAPRFFEEGVEEMLNIDYPDHVKQLMQHYYLMHGTPQTLH
mgnify:CR=1 FL=1